MADSRVNLGGPLGRNSGCEVDEAQLLTADEPQEVSAAATVLYGSREGDGALGVLGAVRSAERTVKMAMLFNILALCGAAYVLTSQGGAVEKVPDTEREHMVQLYSRDMEGRLASIENTTASTEAKLEAGVAAMAGQLFHDPQELTRSERLSWGEQRSKAFDTNRLDAVSPEGGQSDSEIVRKKMAVRMEALQETQERIRSMANRISAMKPKLPLKDPSPDWDCSMKLNSSASAGDVARYTRDCSSSGSWSRVYINTIMREGEGFNTPEVGTLPVGTLVHVVETRGRRVRVDLVGNHPEDAVLMLGWISSETVDHVVILRPSRSAALFYQLRDNHSSLAGTVFSNAKLLAARKYFEAQFKTAAHATKMQHDLMQKIKSIDTERLAAGLRQMDASKEKTRKDIVNVVKHAVAGTEKVLEKDVNRVAKALNDAPATQELVKAGVTALRSAVGKEVKEDLKPEKILSDDGRDLVNQLGASLGL